MQIAGRTGDVIGRSCAHRQMNGMRNYDTFLFSENTGTLWIDENKKYVEWVIYEDTKLNIKKLYLGQSFFLLAPVRLGFLHVDDKIDRKSDLSRVIIIVRLAVNYRYILELVEKNIIYEKYFLSFLLFLLSIKTKANKAKITHKNLKKTNLIEKLLVFTKTSKKKWKISLFTSVIYNLSIKLNVNSKFLLF